MPYYFIWTLIIFIIYLTYLIMTMGLRVSNLGGKVLRAAWKIYYLFFSKIKMFYKGHGEFSHIKILNSTNNPTWALNLVFCLLTKWFFKNYFHRGVKCTYLYLNIYTNIQILYSTNKLTTWNCSQHYLQDVSIFLTEIQWKMHCIPAMNNAYLVLLVLSTGYSTWVTGLEFTKHNN